MLFIFDMGGVLLKNVFELKTILVNHGCELDVAELYRNDLMDDYSSGRIDESQYWEGFNRRFGTSIVPPQWGVYFQPRIDPDTLNLIKSLSKSHRVVCGTNTIDPHWRKSIERGDYLCFHKVYASHIMGVAKPDPRFWEIILEQEQFNPEETFFIDDFPENVAAARSLGIKGILFTDARTLSEELTISL
jgi:putative hydrolase of the HAD superfamily